MLDPGPDEAGRDVLAQDVRTRIEAKGTLKHENKWGLRKMAYEIEQAQRGRLPLVPLRGVQRAA